MKKLTKYITVLCCSAMITLCSCNNSSTSPDADATSPAKVATEEVSEQNSAELLKHWNDGTDSSKEKIEAFVKDITNEKGDHFVPVEDRIATFDMDGTILCEEPDSYDFLVAVDYIQKERADDKQIISALNDLLKMKAELPELLKKAKTDKERAKIQNAYWDLYDEVIPHAFDGVPEDVAEEYTETYMKTNKQAKFENLKCSNTFYLPMLELIQYLQENDFQVYVVSGSMTSIIRGCVKSCESEIALNLESNQMIGSLTSIDASGNKANDSDYVFQPDDEVVRGGTLSKVTDVNMQKVRNIYWQIGKVPIFACGNTDGDFSMLNYAATNEYPHMSALIWHDDDKREYEYNTSDAWKKNCTDYNWLRVSMKDEWSEVF